MMMIIIIYNACCQKTMFFILLVITLIFLFPKALFAFIDRWAVLARYFAWFVSVMTGYDWFRDTTVQPIALTVWFLRIPFCHLFEV